jgi:glycosyltransferase involved in cell wall biosynthesis
MAMGVPVLAANTAIDQYYFNDRLVQFFDSDSVPDLAGRILDLINDPVRRDALSRGGTEFIVENNWNVKCREYLDLVNQLVNRQAKCT